MSPRELRASLSLASIFGLCLFGMFIILPVFALRTRGRPGWSLPLAGIVAIVVLALDLASIAGIVTALVIFFAGFNVLEAKLPALVSRAAPRVATGAATGAYSSVQFLGTFFGAAAGGAIAQHASFMAVLVTCLVVMAAWLAVAWSMGDFVPAAAPASRT